MSEQDPSEIEALLPGGMKEAALRDAVELSGYPLQTVVAGWLADRSYRIDEEWAWLDPEQEVARNLDVVAEHSSGIWHRSERGAILVITSLLIECKQSRNPYLGFAAVSPPTLDAHPRLAGLTRPLIGVHPEGSNSALRVPLMRLLGLTTQPYLRAPLVVSSLSRAHPNGSRVEISGQETFNSVVRPLTKAANRFREHWRSPGSSVQDTIAVRLIFPIAAVDAPLLAVRGRRGASEIEPTTWMRVISRHPADGNQTPRRELGFDVIDVVAADYLESFVDEQVAPFVAAFTESLAKVQDVVLAGSGSLPDFEIGAELPYDLLDRIRP